MIQESNTPQLTHPSQILADLARPMGTRQGLPRRGFPGRWGGWIERIFKGEEIHGL